MNVVGIGSLRLEFFTGVPPSPALCLVTCSKGHIALAAWRDEAWSFLGEVPAGLVVVAWAAISASQMMALELQAQKVVQRQSSSLADEVTAAKAMYQAGVAGVVAGAVNLRQEAFYSIHPDFRSQPGDSSHPSCLVQCGGEGTCLVPVFLVDGDRPAPALRKLRRRDQAWVEDD